MDTPIEEKDQGEGLTEKQKEMLEFIFKKYEKAMRALASGDESELYK